MYCTECVRIVMYLVLIGLDALSCRKYINHFIMHLISHRFKQDTLHKFVHIS